MEDEKLSSIDVREMALKWTTKAEVYKVLNTTGGIYLPPVDQINWDFIRDILSWGQAGKLSFNLEVHRMKQSKNNRTASYRSIAHTDLQEFASKHWAINKYMPEYECEKYHSRKWIWNVSEFLMYHLSIVNSLIQDRFKQFVDGKLTESNDKIDKKHENKFSVLPVMAKVFAETKFISSLL